MDTFLAKKEAGTTEIISYEENIYATLIPTITGNIELNQLKEVIRQVSSRHPYLCSRIEKDEYGRNWVTTEDASEISVSEVSRVNENTWRKVIEDEMSSGFDSGSLVKIVLVKGENINELILIANHGIADGQSLVSVVKDILTQLSAPETNLTPLEAKKGMGDLTRQKRYEVVAPAVGKLLRLASLLPINEADWEEYVRLNRESGYRVFDISLPRELTRQLIKRAERENTTVTGALMTSFAKSFHETYQDDVKEKKLFMPFSIRNDLENISDEDFGLFIGVARPKIPLQKKFWETARIARTNLQNSIRNQKRFLNPAVLISAIKGGIGRRDVLPLFPVVPDYYSLLSNVGKIGIPEKFGQYEISNYRAATSGTPYEVAGVTTTSNGVLTITFTHRVPSSKTDNILTSEQVTATAHKIINKLISES